MAIEIARVDDTDAIIQAQDIALLLTSMGSSFILGAVFAPYVVVLKVVIMLTCVFCMISGVFGIMVLVRIWRERRQKDEKDTERPHRRS